MCHGFMEEGGSCRDGNRIITRDPTRTWEVIKGQLSLIRYKETAYDCKETHFQNTKNSRYTYGKLDEGMQ